MYTQYVPKLIEYEHLKMSNVDLSLLKSSFFWTSPKCKYTKQYLPAQCNLQSNEYIEMYETNVLSSWWRLSWFPIAILFSTITHFSR